MTTHIRKVLPNPTHVYLFTINENSSSPSPPLGIEKREKPSNSNNDNSNSNVHPPFDSAMALTVLALLTALLFMSFFSIYIRHFAGESSSSSYSSSDDSTSRRRRRSSSSAAAYFSTVASYFPSPISHEKAVGVDPTTIQALPVHTYGTVVAKQGIKKLEPEMECAICLSEFEEREWVKEIPYCGHVFHVGCIDTWLSSHVTCPLCRTAKLFPPPPPPPAVVVEEEEEREKKDEGGLGVGEVQGNEVRVVLGVEERDTWQGGGGERAEVGRFGVRRSTSCSWLWSGERMTLNRSLSL